MDERIPDESLETLIAEAAERMVHGSKEIAYSSVIQYNILTDEQNRRKEEEMKRSGKKQVHIFTYELPNY